MNKYYHNYILAPIATPLNIIAFLFTKISYWVASIGKDKEKKYTYANYIKQTFNIRDELEKGVFKKWIDETEAVFYIILEKERAENNITINELKEKIIQLENNRGDRIG